MMKILRQLIIVVSLISCFPLIGSSQDFKKNFGAEMDIFTDIWLNLPADVDPRTLNQGVNVALMYDQPFEKSIVSFALGLGIGTNNLHSNSLLTVNSKGVSGFTPIPERTATKLPLDYRQNKLSFTYLDLPMSLRFKFKEGFRFSAGFKVGLRIDAHTKYHGDELETKSREVFIKEKELQNLQDWRYGVTASIGYKFVQFTGYYGISQIFDTNLGPDISPLSIGISLRPF